MKNVVLMLVLLSGCRFHAADEESFRPIGEPRYDAPQYDSNPLPVRCLVTASTEQATGTIVAVEDGGTVMVQLPNQVVVAVHIDGVEDTQVNYTGLISRIGERVYMDVIYRISSTRWVVEIPALY